MTSAPSKVFCDEQNLLSQEARQGASTGEVARVEYLQLGVSEDVPEDASVWSNAELDWRGLDSDLIIDLISEWLCGEPLGMLGLQVAQRPGRNRQGSCKRRSLGVRQQVERESIAGRGRDLRSTEQRRKGQG